ncbi:type I glyceraldehyde-3-phosphate dehydrogenase [Roseobacter sp.]|uniref:type I glyceraldehyde-3-phosphate dehydrogenase n=1 Tax=Roseobacter sp. TaxID=1907202 RepID=UPI00329A7DE8
MTVTLGINGFGRIGRTVLRALMQRATPGLQVVAIHDPAPADTLMHLFEYDSLHGRYAGPITKSDAGLDLGAGPIRIMTGHDQTTLDWGDVDIVLDCSAQFTDPDKARQHLEHGARRVILSAPATGPCKTIVWGVNEDLITADDLIVSNGSCTTNCLAPVAQVLHSAFGVTRGMMTTVHCYTGAQPTHDAPHSDLYRGRALGLSMIPTTTGAAQTLGEVLPELAGRITGQAIRVPLPNVSCIDLSVEVACAVEVGQVNAAFRAAAAGPLAGTLATTPHKLVSSDFRQDPHSAILSEDQTRVQDGTWVRVLAWYDNEWAFSNRMLDVTARIGGLL